MIDVPSFDDVRRAADILRGNARKTPVLTSSWLDEHSGCRLFMKAENFQRMGAFKFRGAFNALSRLSADERRRGVVAFSSGNHAQAVALAGRELGVRAVLVMPHDAPQSKVDATLAYGGEVVRYDRYTEDRQAIAERLAVQHGLTVIPPYDHADIIAGQGTAALELFEEVGRLDTLFVCLGGGGLLAGTALAASRYQPCRLVGVEPEAGNDAQQSLAAGHIVHIEVPKTIADGAQTQHLGALTFPIIKERVAEIVTVNDDALIEAMKMLFLRLKVVVEPTGCLALAAALKSAHALRGQRVGVILSGGNVDLARFSSLIGSS